MAYQINGLQGKYDGLITDDSVRYGKNAVDNNLKYMEAPLVNDKMNTPPVLDFYPSEEADEKNFAAMDKYINQNDEYLKSLPPLDFEYRYMPQGNVDLKALKAAAYEEMGGAESLSVEEFENRYLLDDTMTAQPLDINKDGKIDNAEYSANILAADILSKGSDDVTKVDGTINAKGLNSVLEYSKISNIAAAEKLYGDIYKTYNLGDLK